MSDGAISFFLDHHVRTRVAKGTYGMDISLPYDKLDPEHVRRSASRLVSLDGLPYTPGAFRVVLPKVGPSVLSSCFVYVDHVRTWKFLRQKNLPAISKALGPQCPIA